MPVTRDRGDIIHFAGRHRLSPALRNGAPELVAQGDPSDRCGWAEMFRVMDARGLALAYDPEDPSSRRFVPSTRARRRRRWSLAAFIREARQLLDALRGRPPRA